jgi:signal transduction histidine kinase
MTVVSLVFLVVCIFGAVAYGSATLMALRQATPVWAVNPGSRPDPPASVDGVSLTMFVACTIWFVLNAWAEFAFMVFDGQRMTAAEISVVALAFLFPPLIMHLVYRETNTPEDGPAVARRWRWPLAVMYLASPAIGVVVLGSIFGWWPRPVAFGRFIGSTFGVLFTVASVYCTLVMVRRRPRRRTTAQRRMSHAMLALFFIVTVIFVSVALLNERSLLVAIFDRVTRTTPIFFLIVSVYFENRFEFYDLVVKRGVMLLATIVALGLMFAVLQPFMDQLPAGPVRPWLAAMLLVPAAMALPWLARSLSSSLDRLWFGREFTAVEAVKHLLGAMQPATSEDTLVVAAERRLAEIFSTTIRVRLDDDPAAGASISVDAATPSGARVGFVVSGDTAGRRLLSEDLQMLRSLAGVFGFMLETTRLQQKRQEQELVAQDLRLQTSRSELKALRAQINPHFLFNALNAIASLIHTNPARADEAVERLAEVFRYTLRRSDSEWAPLDQELAFARAYLDVERARFGARLTCAVESNHVPPVPQVPSMLLQTLIENAVKHGVSQTRGPSRIEVMVRAVADQVIVEVRDNGPGPGATPSLPRDGEGFGLRSVRERLAGHFGSRARLELVRDEGAGVTIARLIMPMVRVAA